MAIKSTQAFQPLNNDGQGTEVLAYGLRSEYNRQNAGNVLPA